MSNRCVVAITIGHTVETHAGSAALSELYVLMYNKAASKREKKKLAQLLRKNDIECCYHLLIMFA